MLNPIKCLLIDDDQDDHDFFLDAVHDLHKEIEVIPAYNGLQGLKALEKNSSPSCIFLDLNMPIMAGKDFLKTIKADPKYKSIPVYILSTSTAERDIFECLSLGATNYLIKPFKPSQLADMLKTTVLSEL